jgi:hypothetical protein
MISGHQISADYRRKHVNEGPSMDINWEIQKNQMHDVQ